MSFAIVTDSLAGLPLAQIARRGLVVIPLSYTISGKEHLCLAPEGYDSAAFFQTMKLRGEVSTSMVPPHRFLTFLKPLLRSAWTCSFSAPPPASFLLSVRLHGRRNSCGRNFPSGSSRLWTPSPPPWGRDYWSSGPSTCGRGGGAWRTPPHPPLPPAPDCPPFHG